MSRFHESVRELLEDIHIFLIETISHEPLSSSTVSHKQKLVSKLQAINQQYPQLQLDFGNSTVPTVRPPEKRFSQSSISRPLSSPPPLPSNPPPSANIKSNFANKEEAVKKADDTYEPCSSEKSFDSFSGDGRIGWNFPLISATDTSKFSKCGFLEKKRKERLGGLIKPTQQRFYAIRDSLLYFFDRSSDQVPKGALSLQGYEARPVYGKDKRNSFYFELVCPGKKSYMFSTTSSLDMKQWMAAIGSSSGYTSNKNLLTRISDYTDASSFNVPSDDIYELVNDIEEEEESAGANAESDGFQENTEKNKDTDDDDPYKDAFNYEDLYIGLWDCKADEDNELQFQRGDVIRIINKEYDTYAWWVGTLNGKVGFVPKTYLMEAYHIYE